MTVAPGSNSTFHWNENFRQHDHTAILRKYYDAKIDLKIINISTSTWQKNTLRHRVVKD
jgi:hypothetical protein